MPVSSYQKAGVSLEVQGFANFVRDLSLVKKEIGTTVSGLQKLVNALNEIKVPREIGQFARGLNQLKTAARGSTSLQGLSGTINKLSDAINRVSIGQFESLTKILREIGALTFGGSAKNLLDLANALNVIEKIKIESELAPKLSQIVTELKRLDGINLGKLPEDLTQLAISFNNLTTASSSIGESIGSLSTLIIAIKQLDGINLSGASVAITEIGTVLEKLASFNVTPKRTDSIEKLLSLITGLKDLGSIPNIDTLSDSITKLGDAFQLFVKNSAGKNLPAALAAVTTALNDFGNLTGIETIVSTLNTLAAPLGNLAKAFRLFGTAVGSAAGTNLTGFIKQIQVLSQTLSLIDVGFASDLDVLGRGLSGLANGFRSFATGNLVKNFTTFEAVLDRVVYTLQRLQALNLGTFSKDLFMIGQGFRLLGDSSERINITEPLSALERLRNNITALGDIFNVFGAGLRNLGSAAASAFAPVISGVQTLASALLSLGNIIFSFPFRVLVAGFNAIGNAISGLTGLIQRIGSLFSNAFAGQGNIASKLGLDGAVTGIKSFNSSMNTLNTSFREAGSSSQFASTGIREVGMSSASADSQVSRLASSMGRLGAAQSGIGRGLRNSELFRAAGIFKTVDIAADVVTDTIYGLGFGLRNAAAEALNAAGTYESLVLSLRGVQAIELVREGQFDTVPQALEEAGRIIEDRYIPSLNKIAIASPLAFDDVANIFKTATNFGFASEQAEDLTQVLVDTAARFNLSKQDIGELPLIFGQIRGAGKLLTQDMKQLAQRGIPLNDIFSRFGTTTEDVIKNGTNADEVIRMLTEGLRFFAGGAAAEATNTIGGLSSTLQSFRDQALRILAFPTVDLLKPLVSAFATQLQSPEVLASLEGFAQRIAESVQTVVINIAAIAGVISTVFSNIPAPILELVKALGVAAAAAIAGSLAFLALQIAVGFMLATFAFAANPIGIAAAALTFLNTEIGNAIATIAKLSLENLFGADPKSQFGDIQALPVRFIETAAAINTATAAINQFAVNAVNTAGIVAQIFAGSLTSGDQEEFDAFGGLIDQLPEQMQTVVETVATGIFNIKNTIVQGLQGVGQFVLQGLQGAIGALQGFIGAINTVAFGIQTAIVNIAVGINGFITSIVNGISGLAMAAGVSASTVVTIASNVTNTLTGLVNQVAGFGSAAISAFAGGIVAAVSLVIAAVQAIANAIAYLLAPGSPPRAIPEIDEWGYQLGVEYLGGFEQSADQVSNSVKPLTDNVRNALEGLDLPGINVDGLLDGLEQANNQSLQTVDELGNIVDQTDALTNATDRYGQSLSEVEAQINSIQAVGALEKQLSQVQAIQAALETNNLTTQARTVLERQLVLAQLELRRQQLALTKGTEEQVKQTNSLAAAVSNVAKEQGDSGSSGGGGKGGKAPKDETEEEEAAGGGGGGGGGGAGDAVDASGLSDIAGLTGAGGAGGAGGKGLLGQVQDSFKEAQENLATTVKNLRETLTTEFKRIKDRLKEIYNGIIQDTLGFASGFRSALDAVVTTVSNFFGQFENPDFIISAFGGLTVGAIALAAEFLPLSVAILGVSGALIGLGLAWALASGNLELELPERFSALNEEIAKLQQGFRSAKGIPLPEIDQTTGLDTGVNGGTTGGVSLAEAILGFTFSDFSDSLGVLIGSITEAMGAFGQRLDTAFSEANVASSESGTNPVLEFIDAFFDIDITPLVDPIIKNIMAAWELLKKTIVALFSTPPEGSTRLQEVINALFEFDGEILGRRAEAIRKRIVAAFELAFSGKPQTDESGEVITDNPVLKFFNGILDEDYSSFSGLIADSISAVFTSAFTLLPDKIEFPLRIAGGLFSKNLDASQIQKDLQEIDAVFTGAGPTLEKIKTFVDTIRELLSAENTDVTQASVSGGAASPAIIEELEIIAMGVQEFDIDSLKTRIEQIVETFTSLEVIQTFSDNIAESNIGANLVALGESLVSFSETLATAGAAIGTAVLVSALTAFVSSPIFLSETINVAESVISALDNLIRGLGNFALALGQVAGGDFEGATQSFTAGIANLITTLNEAAETSESFATVGDSISEAVASIIASLLTIEDPAAFEETANSISTSINTIAGAIGGGVLAGALGGSAKGKVLLTLLGGLTGFVNSVEDPGKFQVVADGLNTLFIGLGSIAVLKGISDFVGITGLLTSLFGSLGKLGPVIKTISNTSKAGGVAGLTKILTGLKGFFGVLQGLAIGANIGAVNIILRIVQGIGLVFSAITGVVSAVGVGAALGALSLLVVGMNAFVNDIGGIKTESIGNVETVINSITSLFDSLTELQGVTGQGGLFGSGGTSIVDSVIPLIDTIQELGNISLGETTGTIVTLVESIANLLTTLSNATLGTDFNTDFSGAFQPIRDFIDSVALIDDIGLGGVSGITGLLDSFSLIINTINDLNSIGDELGASSPLGFLELFVAGLIQVIQDFRGIDTTAIVEAVTPFEQLVAAIETLNLPDLGVTEGLSAIAESLSIGLEAIRSSLEAGIDPVIELFESLTNLFGGTSLDNNTLFTDPAFGGAVGQGESSLFSGLITSLQEGIQSVKDILADPFGDISFSFPDLFAGLSNPFQPLIDFAQNAFDQIEQIFADINALRDSLNPFSSGNEGGLQDGDDDRELGNADLEIDIGDATIVGQDILQGKINDEVAGLDVTGDPTITVGADNAKRSGFFETALSALVTAASASGNPILTIAAAGLSLSPAVKTTVETKISELSIIQDVQSSAIGILESGVTVNTDGVVGAVKTAVEGETIQATAKVQIIDIVIPDFQGPDTLEVPVPDAELDGDTSLSDESINSIGSALNAQLQIGLDTTQFAPLFFTPDVIAGQPDAQEDGGGISSIFGGLQETFSGIAETIGQRIQTTLSSAATATSTGLESVNENITSFTETANGIITSFSEATNTAFVTLLAIVLETFNTGFTQVLAAFNKFQSQATALANSTVNSIRSALAPLPGIMQGIAQQAVDAFVSVFSTLSGRVAGAIGTAVSAIRSQTGAFRSAGRDLGTAIIDGILEGLEAGRGAVNSTTRSIVQGGIDVSRQTVGAQSPATEYIKIGKDVIDGYVMGLNQNAPKVFAASEKIAKTAALDFENNFAPEGKKISERIANDLDEEVEIKIAPGFLVEVEDTPTTNVSDSVEQDTRNIFQKNAEAAQDAISDLGNTINNAINLGLNALVDETPGIANTIFGNNASAVNDAVESSIRNIRNNINGIAQGLTNGGRNEFATLLQALFGDEDTVQSIIGDFITTLDPKLNQSIPAVRDVIERFGNRLENLGDDEGFLRDFLVGDIELGDVIEDQLLDIVNDLKTILDNENFVGFGADITNGIIQGIEGQQDDLEGTAQQQADGFLSALENAYGISSPSRLLRDRIGKELGRGVAVGIADQEVLSDIRESADRLFDVFVQEFRRIGRISSPSKETMKLGGYLGIGISKGIDGSIPMAENSANALYDSILNGLGTMDNPIDLQYNNLLNTLPDLEQSVYADYIRNGMPELESQNYFGKDAINKVIMDKSQGLNEAMTYGGTNSIRTNMLTNHTVVNQVTNNNSYNMDVKVRDNQVSNVRKNFRVAKRLGIPGR